MKYEYWFGNVKGITSKRKMEIRKQVKRAKELYYMSEEQMEKMGLTEIERKTIFESIKVWVPEKKYKEMLEKGVTCIPFYSKDYPEKLKEIYAPPYMLYVKGKLPNPEKKTAAIVGARECSHYGYSMAKEFSSELAKAGVQIVSGMARGVDCISQKSALAVGTSSFAVLGCGVDICYPREEMILFMDLEQKGGILSEYPIGTAPLKQHFPARNRLISGIADAVLVIEAKEKSGSLITADMALEQGKDVYALPGPVNSALSQGCNNLIKQGADILLSPEKLLIEWGISPVNLLKKDNSQKKSLEQREKLVYSCLDFHPQNLGQLIRDTHLSVSELLDSLVYLEVLKSFCL